MGRKKKKKAGTSSGGDDAPFIHQEDRHVAPVAKSSDSSIITVGGLNGRDDSSSAVGVDGSGRARRSRGKRSRMRKRATERARARREAVREGGIDNKYRLSGDEDDDGEESDSDATPRSSGAPDRRNGGIVGRKRRRRRTDERKEKRAEGSAPPSTAIDATCGGDCYLDVLREAGRGRARSSWLNRSPWIGPPSSSVTVGQCLPAAAASDREKLGATHKRLVEIKRRLWPAAVRCAEAGRRVEAQGGGDGRAGGEREEGARRFADEKTPQDLMVAKMSETTPEAEFIDSRRACNPFERLGEGRDGGLNRHFVCRSAVKLANIDAMLEFQLTSRVEDTKLGQSLFASRDDPFLFVDLCGAPGGFSEYIMWRCKQNGIQSSRGYGMSLNGKNEHGAGIHWRLDHMATLKGDSTSHFHVSSGADGSGDVYNWENILALERDIKMDLFSSGTCHSERTSSSRLLSLVDLVVADGGFDAQRDAEDQEALSFRLSVCQSAAALHLLRPGGTFLLKSLGFRMDTTVRLIKNLSGCFHRVAIIKPISSRPASAERYIVFHKYLGTRSGWDGLIWRDVFLKSFVTTEQAVSEERDQCCQDKVSNFPLTKESLDWIDPVLGNVEMDILSLNINACQEILADLNRKENTYSDGSEILSKKTKGCANVSAYKQKWSLG